MNWTGRHLRAAVLIVLLGSVLRAMAFTSRLPLTLDEAAIARNLAGRTGLELLAPLDHAQLAPPGFLIVEKLFVIAFGDGELALRAFPLVSALLALIVCLMLVRRLLRPAVGLAALALLAISRPLVEYAAVAKPYSSDVLATLAVLLLVARTRGASSGRQRAGIAAAAVLIALFSFTTVFTLAAAMGAGLVLGATASGAAERRRELALSVVWLPALLAAIAAGRHVLTPDDAGYMAWFWSSGFPPPAVTQFPEWLARRTLGLFGQTAGLRFSTVWTALALFGVWSLWRRSRGDAALVLGLVPLAAVAAALVWQYPLEPGRLQHFLLPVGFLLAAEGGDALAAFLPPRPRWVGALPAALLVVASATLTSTRPAGMASDDVRSFVETVSREWQPGDAVYVYHWAGLPFLYYAPRAGLDVDVTLGHCAHGSVRSYFRELDALAGRSRVWIALPHRRDPEIDAIRGYLDATGQRLAEVPGEVGYLYDLRRRAEGATHSAADYPLPAELDAEAPVRWSCHGVFDIPRM